jgi:hypothetical protein
MRHNGSTVSGVRKKLLSIAASNNNGVWNIFVFGNFFFRIVFDDRIAPLAAAVLRGQSFCEM